MATATATQFYLDDKWKLSKKEGGGVSRFMRSSSSSSSFSASAAAAAGAYQKKNQRHGRCAFSRKCARLVKEQRARFYIMRRCVIMLICWRDYSDS